MRALGRRVLEKDMQVNCKELKYRRLSLVLLCPILQHFVSAMFLAMPMVYAESSPDFAKIKHRPSYHLFSNTNTILI